MDGNLRGLFRDHLPQVHWQSIESGMTGRGIPDTNGCCQGQEFWIEFKENKHWVVALRPEQIGWMLQRTRAGGRVFVALRRAVNELWLLDGAAAKDLRDLGLRRCPSSAVLGVYSGGPRAWDWGDILNHLTKKGTAEAIP